MNLLKRRQVKFSVYTNNRYIESVPKGICRFFLRKISDDVRRLAITSISFHIVFPYIFNFPSLFRAASPLPPEAATQVSFYSQDSLRYFPLPANWTIKLVALIPRKRVFARTAYFLAHPLFGSSFAPRSASQPPFLSSPILPSSLSLSFFPSLSVLRETLSHFKVLHSC